jgi:hypothetical protein
MQKPKRAQNPNSGQAKRQNLPIAKQGKQPSADVVPDARDGTSRPTPPVDVEAVRDGSAVDRRSGSGHRRPGRDHGSLDGSFEHVLQELRERQAAAGRSRLQGKENRVGHVANLDVYAHTLSIPVPTVCVSTRPSGSDSVYDHADSRAVADCGVGVAWFVGRQVLDRLGQRFRP